MSDSATNRAEIAFAFQAELGRPASEVDLEAWDGAFQNGSQNVASMEDFLSRTTESQNAVAAEFQNELGRAASSADLQNWQQQLGAGTYTLTSLASYLSQTQEAIDEINNIYERDLGRGSDSWGLQAWENSLAQGGLQQVRNGIAFSQEAASDINSLYQKDLERPGDTSGVAYYQGLLAQGESLTDVNRLLQASTEEADDINAIYQKILGRDADAGDFAWADAGLQNGAVLPDFRYDVAYSSEAATRIQNLYVQVIGYTADPASVAFWQSRLATNLTFSDVRYEFYQWQGATDALNAAFEAVLGRPVDAAFLQAYITNEGYGAPISEIKADLAYTAEATGLIQAAYQQVLGRTATQDEVKAQQIGLAAGQSLAGLNERVYLHSLTNQEADFDAAYYLAQNPDVAASNFDALYHYQQDGINEGRIPNGGFGAAPGLSSSQVNQVEALYQYVLGRNATAAELSSVQQSVGRTIAPTVVGVGQDAIDLKVSEDAYLGDAEFIVSVDGQQVGGMQVAAASHGKGQDQDFIIEGNFGAGSHTVTVNFLNDAYAGTPSTDRNLYVDGASYNGTAVDQSQLDLGAAGPLSFTIPAGIGQPGTVSPAAQDTTPSEFGGSFSAVLNNLRGTLFRSSEEASKVNAIYQQELGHGIDPASLMAFQAAEGYNQSLAEIHSIVARSTDATNDINAVYQAVLGRNANATELAVQQNALSSGMSLDNVLQVLRPVIAFSAEAANDIRAISQAETGQTPNDVVTLALQTDMANGASQSDIWTFFSKSDQGASGINALYEADLGYGADSTGIAIYEQALANGASWTDVRNSIAKSPEAASAIQTIGQTVLGHTLDAGYVQQLQGMLAGGSSLTNIRNMLATSTEVINDINTTFEQVSSHGADGMTLGQVAAALEAGQSLSSVEDFVVAKQLGSGDANATAKADNAIYQQVLGRTVDAAALAADEADLAAGESFAAIRQFRVTSSEGQSALDGLYEDVLGREIDPSGQGTFTNSLVLGASLADVRNYLANSAEGASVIQSFYQVTFGRPASADELIGMQFAEALTISDNDQFGFLKADGTVLAMTSPDNLLAQLPVAVTLYNGATPLLALPNGGGSPQFANATQLAAAVLALDIRQGLATQLAFANYALTVNWLNQIDQPMLQVAATLAAQAQYAMSVGNDAQATLAATAYSLALKIAALPPEARNGPGWGLSQSVQVNGHTTVVIVYDDTSTPYGHVIYHDKETDIVTGIIEPIVTVIVDVLAFVPVIDVVFAPLAVVLNAAEAGQSFAEGNILGGVLHLASAVGFGFAAYGVDIAGQSLNGPLAAEGKAILAVTAAVGGTSSIVQSAENGDALGAIAGALTIAAAAASQNFEITGSDPVIQQSGITITQALAAAAVGTAVSDALSRGDVSSALITSLGPLFSAGLQISGAYQEAVAAPGVLNGLDGQPILAPPMGGGTPPYGPALAAFIASAVAAVGSAVSAAVSDIENIFANSPPQDPNDPVPATISPSGQTGSPTGPEDPEGTPTIEKISSNTDVIQQLSNSSNAGDKLVGNTAKSLQDAGYDVLSVNKEIYSTTQGRVLGDIDIETKNAIIEVTTSSSQKTQQIMKLVGTPELNGGKTVILYAPNYGGTAGTSLTQTTGVQIARNIGDLLKLLGGS